MSGQKDDTDVELFRAAVADVAPIEQDKVKLKPPGKNTKRKTEVTKPPEVRPPDHGQAIPVRNAGNRGISNSDLRKLRRGLITPSHTIDLHGSRRDEARIRLNRTIATCISDGVRCLVVIHGKGHHSDTGISVIQREVLGQLQSHPQVVAWCTALPRDGGTGATYAYLRRDRFRMRR